eukprot:SAG31_NODE_129_length_23447_cov_5.010922_3_plen_72_part_00
MDDPREAVIAVIVKHACDQSSELSRDSISLLEMMGERDEIAEQVLHFCSVLVGDQNLLFEVAGRCRLQVCR